jgi:hypothetical protein
MNRCSIIVEELIRITYPGFSIITIKFSESLDASSDLLHVTSYLLLVLLNIP